MRQAMLFILQVDRFYGKSHLKDKNFRLKGTWSGSRDRFGGEGMFFKFCKCFDCGVLMFLDG